MIHSSEKRVRTVTEEIVKALTCDLCRCQFIAGLKGDEASWRTEHPCHFEMTTVAYSELKGGVWIYEVTKHVALHICPNCFVNRLVPWVKEQGDSVAEPTA